MSKIEQYGKALTSLNNGVAPDVELRCDADGVITIDWKDMTPIDMATIDAKVAELPSEEDEATAQANLKASAKAKLISGEALTEEEANTIVL
tara:strand:- start:747 stop:1022 length:276 start_codon:yes stop_codon:yes gene_type:complete